MAFTFGSDLPDTSDGGLAAGPDQWDRSPDLLNDGDGARDGGGERP